MSILRIFNFIVKHWWKLFIIIGFISVSYFFIGFTLFKYVIYIIAILFFIFLLLPYFAPLFFPTFLLISSLKDHFKTILNYNSLSKTDPWYKNYIFVPMALVSLTLFIIAHFVLFMWIFISSVLIWSSILGPFLTFIFTFILMLLFDLVIYLAILTTPFIVWYKFGFSEFLNIAAFFIIAIFWYILLKFAFPKKYHESISINFINFSYIFLLGALSLQIIALPIYVLSLFIGNSTLRIIGDGIAVIGGGLLLLLSFVSAIVLTSEKKKLTLEEKEFFHPPIIVYFFAWLISGFLHGVVVFRYGIQAPVLSLLVSLFLILLIIRFLGFIKLKIILRHNYKNNHE